MELRHARTRLKPRRTRFGEMLRLYRTVRSQTLRELAPMIGLSAATLMRIEMGYAMDAATLLKVLAWLFTSEAGGER